MFARQKASAAEGFRKDTAEPRMRESGAKPAAGGRAPVDPALDPGSKVATRTRTAARDSADRRRMRKDKMRRMNSLLRGVEVSTAPEPGRQMHLRHQSSRSNGAATPVARSSDRLSQPII